MHRRMQLTPAMHRLGLIWWTMYGMFVVGLTPNVKVAAVISSNFYSLANL